jgi:type VI secretion system protein ImpF
VIDADDQTDPRPTRRGNDRRPLRQSLLDRLTDAEPRVPTEREPTRSESVDALHRSVRRDLEWLLNTRRERAVVSGGHPEARKSVLRYGLPDLASLSRDGNAEHVLAGAIQDAITLFEPRLMHVRVVPNEVRTPSRPELRFTVEASLRMDPAPERVVFDTVLELSKGEYQVRDAGGGTDA